MHLFYQPNAVDNRLSDEESHHCYKVLRQKIGDEIIILDGTGSEYLAKLTKVGKLCEYEIIKIHNAEKPVGNIHLAIAPTKNADRIEWMVEKITEIGVSQITWLNCANSERSRLNTDRLIKKAVSAMKQSKRLYLPIQSALIDYSKFVVGVSESEKYIAYVDNAPRPHLYSAVSGVHDVVVLVGPEGDFSQDEIELAFHQGFEPVSLGTTRLRTETAGVVATHTMVLKQQLSQ